MIYSQEFFFSEEMFGMDRMLASQNRNSQDTPEMVLKNVRLAVDGFVGETEQFDDLTMLCIEYRGNGTACII